MEAVDISALDVLSIKEAATKTRLSSKTIGRLCKSGGLESFKVGRRRLIPATSVAAFIAKQLAEEHAARTPAA